MSSLTGTQQLGDDARRQGDEVQHLVVLQDSVVLHEPPYESRHESDRGHKELQGGRREAETCADFIEKQ